MILNNTTLKKIEADFPFTLTPEQKSILLLWFGADSKFGWTKLDFLVGAHRARRLYPDHRTNRYRDLHGCPDDPAIDFTFNYDGYDNPVIRLYDGVDIPF